MEIDKLEVEIRFIRKGKLVANAAIKWGDMGSGLGFTIRGFKILQGKFNDFNDYDLDGTPIWLAPPSYPDTATGAYHDIMFCSKLFWKKLNQKIMAEFHLKNGS